MRVAILEIVVLPFALVGIEKRQGIIECGAEIRAWRRRRFNRRRRRRRRQLRPARLPPLPLPLPLPLRSPLFRFPLRVPCPLSRPPRFGSGPFRRCLGPTGCPHLEL